MSKQKNQMNAPDREQGSRINKDTAKRLLSYIGDYITPILAMDHPVYTGLIKAL